MIHAIAKVLAAQYDGDPKRIADDPDLTAASIELEKLTKVWNDSCKTLGLDPNKASAAQISAKLYRWKMRMAMLQDEVNTLAVLKEHKDNP